MTQKQIKTSPFNKALDGLFLKDWVCYHMNNDTKYTNIALGLRKVFNLDDNKIYVIQKDIDEINIVEVKQ